MTGVQTCALPILRPLAEQNKYSLVELAMAGCPPMIGIAPASATLGPMFARTCLRFQDDAVRYLERDESIQVVVLAGRWAGPFQDTDGAGYVDRSAIGKPMVGELGWALARAGLDRLVSELEASGKMVYLLQDAPSYSFDPTEILLTRDLWLRYKVARWMESPIDRKSTRLNSSHRSLSRMPSSA